jgi:hypothetical protein
MPINRQDRVDHWRALAAEVFDAAVQVTDQQARVTLTSIAALYEELAITAELTDRPMAPTPQPIPRADDRASSIDSMRNSTEPRMDWPQTEDQIGQAGHALNFPRPQHVMRPRRAWSGLRSRRGRD